MTTASALTRTLLRLGAALLKAWLLCRRALLQAGAQRCATECILTALLAAAAAGGSALGAQDAIALG
jgi:hypothetical protein